MDFQTALAELVRAHPDAALGASVQAGGHYYPAASGMTYRRVNDDVHRSTAEHSRMWLYYNDGGIYCGPKEWPEYENV